MSASRNEADRPFRREPAPGALETRAPDARARNGCRRVVLFQDRVVIDRTVCGVAMRVAVPSRLYRGVCIGLKTGAAGRTVYEVRLDHRDPDLCVTLREALDESALWAEWRAWARFFDLPATLERDGGQQVMLTRTRKPAPAHSRRVRRRRRPGLVTKRAVRPDAMATVHREPEIIART